MKTHTAHGNVVKVAVGYVRVSTLEQAPEGVSLDAQRDKIRAYCKFNGIQCQTLPPFLDAVAQGKRVP